MIRPASFCGVAAIKPSYRLLPPGRRENLFCTLDTVGLFAAGVEDVAMALAAITGRSELNAAELKSPRIGVVTQDFAGPPEAGGAEALQHAARAAAKAGASVRELKMPEIVAEAWRIHIIVQRYQAHQAFAWSMAESRCDAAAAASGSTTAAINGGRLRRGAQGDGQGARCIERDFQGHRRIAGAVGAGLAPKGLDSTATPATTSSGR